MSGPWSDYSAPPPSDGPWSDFSAPKSEPNVQPLVSHFQAKEANGLAETLEAGFESSIVGLIARGKNPNYALPSSASFLQRQEYNLAQMVPDIPVYIAGGAAGGVIGGAAGGAAGTAVPVIGNVAGAAAGGVAGTGAGAMMLPTAIRETLMDAYANGSVKSFADLWNRAAPILGKTLKAGVVGAVTHGVGKVAAPLASKAAAPLAETVSPVVASGVATTTTLATQAATLATVGAFVDGRTPTATDFEDSALVMFGFHAATEGAAKLRSIYAKTGIKPADVVADAQRNPGVAQDLLSTNIETPEDYKAAVAPEAEKTAEPPKENELDVPGFGRINISQEYDIPWAGGSSKDGKTVYFQSGLNLIKAIGGKSYDFRIPGAIHELTERKLEDEGESYTDAHNAAEVAEDSWVRENWPEIADQYEQHWKADIEAAEAKAKSGSVKVPPDLVVKPYEHPDNPLEEKMHQEVFGGDGQPPGEPPSGESTPEDAQRRILDRLSIGEAPKEKTTLTQRWDGFQRAVIDSLYPLKRMVKDVAGGKELDTAKDPGKLAQLMNGVAGKAQAFIDYGTRDVDSKQINGKALKDILSPVKDDLDGFRAYWVAKRALELDAKGIKTGMPLDAAQQLASDAAMKAKYNPVLDELRDYRANLLNYGKAIIGEDNIRKMLSDHPNYAPFNRVIEKAMAGGTGKQPFNPIKAIKGSERTVIDPLESLIKQTYQIVTLTERNAVNQAIADLPEQFPEAADYIKKVPRKVHPIDVEAGEIKKALDEQGIKGDPDGFTIFRPNAMNPAPDMIAVFRDGKRYLYQVPEDVAAAVKGLDRETVQPWVRILGKTSQGLRIGTTLTPEFQLRHALRMAVYSFLYSDKLELPFAGLMRGAVGVLTKDKAYQDMMFHGAGHANIQSFDRSFLQGSLEDAVNQSGIISKSSWNVVGQGISKLQGLSQFMDTAWRLGEYKAVTARGGSPEEAAYKARTVIVDLAQSGARMKALNSITAFQQTIINDSVRMLSALKNEPAKVLPRIAAGIVLPSVLLWAANRKNEAVQNAPDWEKDTYWLVPTGDKPDDVILRYPKPFGVGVLFGSGVERGLDFLANQNPKAFDHFASELVKSMVPTELPNFASPIIEQFANKSLFTGGPIIPHDREGVLPAYQYTPYTSETAKAIGRLVGMLPGEDKPGALASPAVIENYIKAWTGTMGTYALAVSDWGLKKAGLAPDIPKPAASLSDIPFVRAFVVRYPSAGAQPVQDFYDNLGKVEAVQTAVQKLMKEGNFREAVAVQQTHPYDMIRLQEVGKGMAAASQLIRNVYKDPAMSPDDKRQIIDSAYYQMIQMAKQGNLLYAQSHKQISSETANP